MINRVVLMMSFMVSICYSASKESVMITQKIASHARTNLTKSLGKNYNSKVENTIKSFERIAPPVIDVNSRELMSELKSNPEIGKGQILSHKLALKYATKTTNTIKAKVQHPNGTNGRNTKDTIRKRNTAAAAAAAEGAGKSIIGGAWGVSFTILALMGMVAFLAIGFLFLTSLVGFFGAMIRRFYLRARYGYHYAGGYPASGPPVPVPVPVPVPAAPPMGNGYPYDYY